MSADGSRIDVRTGRGLAFLLGLVALTTFVGGRFGASAQAEPAPAYELVALPTGVDTLSSLTSAVARAEACAADCSGVLYFWSPRMPLSRSAIPNVESAARILGTELTLVGSEDLERYAESLASDRSVPAELGHAILASGALTHAPALVVHRGGRVVGPAILGYKGADAYRTMIASRLAEGAAGEPSPREVSLFERSEVTEPSPVSFRDLGAVGVPGAYFRWVPGRDALAYESGRRVYLMSLTDGETRVAPGFIDFVPTPDGRYFVTPGNRNLGLEFYDADQVFEAARQGRSSAVRPIFTDDRMRDQYPSVGILASNGSGVRYRVMTSWFEGLLYADYQLTYGEGGAAATVLPLGAPVVPCRGMSLSTPIMSQDGTEVAARDEATGTTKIFTILDGGRCAEALSLGMPTRKVAWHASGRKLAFSTPRVRAGSGGGADPGIFVYDRDERRVTRVADSNGASQLAFPDFIGDDAVVFMVPGRSSGETSFFRIVEPIP